MIEGKRVNKTYVAFCDRWLSAWTGNQPEELIRFYSEDAYYQDPAKPEGLKGKETLLNYFRKLLAKYPDWIWETVEVFPHAQGFTLKWKAKLNPSAETFYGLDIVEVVNGKITRNEVYFDPRSLVE